ncbi:restriction endonuclease subunit S [Labilibaculum euxinus]|uniref:Restriction endonuclease n=1 Tax=Labilibaculum euxinus TaxID=2686357 RepID=A0A7M4DAB8_9BACT|nr:restriction endonuclease subunit S [Labilibaculum euxinus]MUP39597.1 restriction endonuclease [Labilibaculum euxinus]MVB08802.1 restriction endonuclease [Labilibaculum euxinus]
MNLQLSNRKWKQFKLATIFTIENCKCSKVSGLQKGSTPYVGATNRNNGVINFVKVDKKLITKGNCIAFICDGEGSVGYSIYKSEDFIGSTTVKVGRNKKLNKYNAAFITTIADTVRSKYNFGFKRNETHLKNEILILPANEKDEPDFEFMEAFMQQKEQEKFKQYNNYISQRFTALKDFKTVVPIEDKEFLEFEIEKLFNVKSGKRLTKADMKKGNKPFIGATDSNNGITAFVSNSNSSVDSNVLGVNYNGSVVENFYHPYKAIFSDDVKRLSFKEIEGNKHLFLFVKTQILKQKAKYQYGYKFNGTRMNKQKIMLPVNEKNEPDYDYMENYMKQLEYEKLNKYLTKKTTQNANA